MNTTETGLCHCGCGQTTQLAPKTSTRKGWVKGEPMKYVRGHYKPSSLYSLDDPPEWYLPNTNDGYCHCGCGLKTKPARYTSQEQGTIKGALRRFVGGHHIVNDERAEEETKRCQTCKEEKLLRYFYSSKSEKDGYTRKCMACYRSLDGDQKEHKRRSTKALRERNRKYVWDWYCTHPCVDCGEDDPIVLELDHVRGEKREQVSKMVNNSNSIETIQAEIDKCDVVCVNCHRRRTARTQDWYASVA